MDKVLVGNEGQFGFMNTGKVAVTVQFGVNVPKRTNIRGQVLTPTGCIVTSTKHGLGFGRADCSPCDEFNTDTGRKLALTRAVQHFPEEVRQAVWDVAFQGGLIRK